MKKKLLLITLMFFVSISSTILAQTEQRLRVKELEFDGVKKDEYLGDKLISIDDLQAKTKAKCTEFRCEGYENISFKKYDIQHTLRMENLIRSIQGKAIRDWLFIQEKIVKTELDKINFTKTTSKYGDHYKAARGIYFEKLERGITKNNLNYYNRSYGNSIKTKKTKGTSIMKDIKRLTLRRQEIKNGNINNSSYGSYKYKGKPLSHYKSLKEVSNLLKSELSNYYNNDVAINDNQRIKNRLNQMIKDMSPSSVSKDLMLKRKNFFIDLLNRKESHFKSFSNWNELNLMQKYINKVYKGNNPGTVWPKDFGTKKFVLSHAKSKKLGSLTVFHPNYWKVILKNKYKNSWFYNSKAKADHAKLKQAEINKLIASTPINANLAVDFIVEDIKITDLNQLEWLNSIPEKEANRIKGILQMAKTSWGSDLDLGSIYKQKKEIEIERIKNAGLVVQMVKTLGITNSTQKSWLYNNIPEATQIRFFVDANKIRGVVSQETKRIIMDYFNILDEMPYAKFNRYEELLDLLEKNPFVFLQDCIQQNGLAIENYQQLYDHTLPETCKARLNNLGSGYNDQPLNAGNAAVANVDYYGVEITKNPDFNVDGKPDTNAEVFQAYKRNFTSWASGSKKDFQFSCNIPFDSDNKANVSWKFVPYGSTDVAIWNSTNPLTTIIGIDASSDIPFGDAISDDGAIMISAYTSQYWIGSTIQTPFSGTQPFSGNRQWGYLTNQKGNLELYARAVDIARVSGIIRFSEDNSECSEDTYYNIGEATWSNLQEQIKTWVNANGGVATVVPKTAIRFDKTKLKELLESNESINQINCK